MTQHDKQVQQVFPFWRAVEALTPQKLDKDNPKDNITPAYNIASGAPLPWQNPEHTRKCLPKNKVWRYTAQCGVYDLAMLSTRLESKIGAHGEVFNDRTSGQSRLFDISFNEHGIPQFASFMLSLSVWSAGQILEHKQGVMALSESIRADFSGFAFPSDEIPYIDSGFSDFDDVTRYLMQWIANEASRMQKEKVPADLAWILQLEKTVLEKTYFPRDVMSSKPVALVKCTQVKAPEPPTETKSGTLHSSDENEKDKQAPAVVAVADDLINSFFIDELHKLGSVWQYQNYGPGFAEYMSAIARPRHRIDIRSPEGLDIAFQHLLPTHVPKGAWPSEYPLAFSQQLAVNEIWRRNADQAGIFAVNGPPGTGKTTLLRDVVAAVVTARAEKLINLKADAFSYKKSIKLGDTWIPYYSLHDALKGTAIVVASANNGAVENISLELPGKDAVPDSVLTQSDYFADLVSELIEKPGWGLLAARLGNKENREKFMKVFWWRKPEENKSDASRQANVFSPESGEGLAYHLNKLHDGSRKPQMQWDDAVARFQKAQADEDAIRQQIIQYATLDEQIGSLHHRVNQARDALDIISDQLLLISQDLSTLDADVLQQESHRSTLQNQLAATEQRLHQHQSNKPGMLFGLATLGRSHREWWDRYRRLEDECDSTRAEIALQQTSCNTAKKAQADTAQQHAALKQKQQLAETSLVTSREKLNVAERFREQAKSVMGAYWPDRHASDNDREKSAPWAIEKWRKARESLFLAALDVQRSFIENHPEQMIKNINLANDWLRGRSLPEAQATLALESLSLIVPVISTTFASIPRMFKHIGREAIGWLLIDEAGQALPQQAAGAIWRAARTVVVGDPKQLEPVSGIPSIVEGGLGRHFGVPASWWPGDVSAQILADHTMDLGTYLPDPVKDSVWVGSPLRVHRRCDDPMFTISNRIAYDGLMVHGKKKTAMPLPDSCWIDVVGQNCEGNWIVEEGAAVQTLLHDLQHRFEVQPADIFLISPFKDCSRKLSSLASKLGFDTKKTGTVHTTQGKEASIVVLVLGGNVQKPGARAWAASRPNLLNVAVSRAKQRLYVIGDRTKWQTQQYFSTLAKNLPAKTEDCPDVHHVENIEL